MKTILSGAKAFKGGLSPQEKEHFEKAAKGQNPEALFITCSDSRVLPHKITQTSAGSLFVLRNIGNIVPTHAQQEPSVAAALEFAVLALKIPHIIVCGHSECGAMEAVLQGNIPLKAVGSWLKNEPATNEGLHFPSTLSKVNQLSWSNVLRQCNHLKTYPFIEERLKKGEITVHGWWFDIKTATLFEFDADKKTFLPLV